MENLRHRGDSKFVANATEVKRFTLKRNFLTFQIIHTNLFSLNISKTSIFWNKPTPVAAAILDLSKIALHTFHYNELKPRFGDKVTLFYIEPKQDLYSDMESYKNLLGLSDYPRNHKLYDATNKKKPLTMKDELNGQFLQESTCLGRNFTL